MKLLILTAVVLVLGTVESTPLDKMAAQGPEEMVFEQTDTDLDMKQPPSEFFKNQLKKFLPSANDKPQEIESVNEEGVNEQIEQYLEAQEVEVKAEEYLQENKNEVEIEDNAVEIEESEDNAVEIEESEDNAVEIEESEDNEVEAQGNHRIRHGNTIALRTFDSFQWLGCAGNPCGRASCPRMLMMSKDYRNCWGEVFRIYRALGGGDVRSGDVVGIYYPRDKKWLGCAGNRCGKAGCPGRPSNRHGFQSHYNWFRCWGEVFVIFARGKSDGSFINAGDHVAFYYIRDSKWLAQGPGQTQKLPCLGNNLPPPLNQYDGCAYETFRIHKQ